MKLSVMVHTVIPPTWEVDAEGSQVQGQAWQIGKTLPQLVRNTLLRT